MSIKFSDFMLKEPPMTIIAAMKESETSILIAVDSQQTQTPGNIPSFTDTKLQWHPSIPLAWGVADNATIGMQFSETVKKLQFTPDISWDSLADQLNKQLSTFNKKQREHCKRAGVNPAPGELASVLVVGFLGSEGRIFEIDDKGVFVIMPHGFHAIGSGRVCASIAQRILSFLPARSTVEAELKAITAATAELINTCGPPVHWGRVTPDGFQLLG